MKNYSLTLIFSILSIFGYSQEICDNGIDDDGNGLIDLQDNSCKCEFYNFDSIPSLIPNHSFEDKLCCPIVASSMNCVMNWQKASNSTSDYFNLCGLTDLWATTVLPPIPIADGNGYCGFINQSFGFEEYKEYLGSCLSDTMYAGKTYQIIAQIAFGTGKNTNSFELFGSNNCSNIPFPTTATQQCPIDGTGNWISLNSKTIILDKSKWNTFKLTFTPSQDITTIAIGPACRSNFESNYILSYYYIDNIVLNKTDKFGPEVVINSKGSFCTNDLILFVNYDSIPHSIQWYKDSIAIVGENSTSFAVPSYSSGTYQVKLEFDSGCIIKSFQPLKNEEYELEMPNVFSPNNDNVNDIFKPIEFNCIAEATLNIYNRWGQIVYESSDLPLAWDGKTNGKECSTGVYFWTISLEGKEGEIKESGSVSLFR